MEKQIIIESNQEIAKRNYYVDYGKVINDDVNNDEFSNSKWKTKLPTGIPLDVGDSIQYYSSMIRSKGLSDQGVELIGTADSNEDLVDNKGKMELGYYIGNNWLNNLMLPKSIATLRDYTEKIAETSASMRNFDFVNTYNTYNIPEKNNSNAIVALVGGGSNNPNVNISGNAANLSFASDGLLRSSGPEEFYTNYNGSLTAPLPVGFLPMKLNYQFTHNQIIHSYRIWPRTGNTQVPKSWFLYGAENLTDLNNGHFTELHSVSFSNASEWNAPSSWSVSGQQPAANFLNLSNEFVINTTHTSFKFFQLKITETFANPAFCGISEFALYGTTPDDQFDKIPNVFFSDYGGPSIETQTEWEKNGPSNLNITADELNTSSFIYSNANPTATGNLCNYVPDDKRLYVGASDWAGPYQNGWNGYHNVAYTKSYTKLFDIVKSEAEIETNLGFNSPVVIGQKITESLNDPNFDDNVFVKPKIIDFKYDLVDDLGIINYKNYFKTYETTQVIDETCKSIPTSFGKMLYDINDGTDNFAINQIVKDKTGGNLATIEQRNRYMWNSIASGDFKRTRAMSKLYQNLYLSKNSVSMQSMTHELLKNVSIYTGGINPSTNWNNVITNSAYPTSNPYNLGEQICIFDDLTNFSLPFTNNDKTDLANRVLFRDFTANARGYESKENILAGAGVGIHSTTFALYWSSSHSTAYSGTKLVDNVIYSTTSSGGGIGWVNDNADGTTGGSGSLPTNSGQNYLRVINSIGRQEVLYKFYSNKIVNRIILFPIYDDTLKNRNIKKYEIRGTTFSTYKNDDPTTYTLLHTHIGDDDLNKEYPTIPQLKALTSTTNTASGNINLGKKINFENTTPFETYVIYMTENYGALTYMGTNEIVLVNIENESEYKTPKVNEDVIIGGGGASTSFYNVDASSELSTAKKINAVDNIINNGVDSTFWATANGSALPSTFSFEYPNAVKVNKYAIFPRYNPLSRTQNIKSWQLRAATSKSAYNNNNYVVLDSRSLNADINLAWPNMNSIQNLHPNSKASDNMNLATTFTIANPDKYKFYLLNITANFGSNVYSSLNEFILISNETDRYLNLQNNNVIVTNLIANEMNFNMLKSVMIDELEKPSSNDINIDYANQEFLDSLYFSLELGNLDDKFSDSIYNILNSVNNKQYTEKRVEAGIPVPVALSSVNNVASHLYPLNTRPADIPTGYLKTKGLYRLPLYAGLFADRDNIKNHTEGTGNNSKFITQIEKYRDNKMYEIDFYSRYNENRTPKSNNLTLPDPTTNFGVDLKFDFKDMVGNYYDDTKIKELGLGCVVVYKHIENTITDDSINIPFIAFVCRNQISNLNKYKIPLCNEGEFLGIPRSLQNNSLSYTQSWQRKVHYDDRGVVLTAINVEIVGEYVASNSNKITATLQGTDGIVTPTCSLDVDVLQVGAVFLQRILKITITNNGSHLKTPPYVQFTHDSTALKTSDFAVAPKLSVVLGDYKNSYDAGTLVNSQPNYPYIMCGANDIACSFDDTQSRMAFSKLHTMMKEGQETNNLQRYYDASMVFNTEQPIITPDAQSANDVIKMNVRKTYCNSSRAGFTEGIPKIDPNNQIIPISNNAIRSQGVLSAISGVGILKLYTAKKDGSYLEINNFNSYTFKGTLFDKIGFNINQLVAKFGKQNTFFNRGKHNKYIDTKNKALLMYENSVSPLTTNALISSSLNQSINTNNINYLMGSLDGNNLLEKSVSQIPDSLIAENLPQKFSYSHILVNSNIIPKYNYIAGQSINNVSCIASINRSYEVGDWIYGNQPGIEYMVDKKYILTDIDIDLKTETGLDAPIDSGSTIVIKINKRKPIPQ